MINLNQNAKYPTTPLLRLGFRPFFFASAIIAVVSMLLWMLFYQSIFIINSDISGAQWHAHEMIYAYASAVVVGFLLTASQNWTGIQTIYSKPLLALFLLWISGRFLAFIDSNFLFYQAIIDTGFLLFATSAIAYPIIKGKHWNNISIIAKVVLLSVAHIVYYLGVLGVLNKGVDIGIYAGFYLIIGLLFMMSRRLLPFFIERGLGLKTTLKNSKILDFASLFLFLIFIVIEVFFLDSNPFYAILPILLFAIHLKRMFNWYDKGIWTKSLLWSAYCAYGFLTLGFAINAAAYFFVVTPNLDTHSFAFGIALMTLSMMSRVSLGHTGRNVFSPPKSLNIIFILLALSFFFRVVIMFFFGQYYTLWIVTSQVLWIVSFAYFAIVYTPMFFQARVDGQFG